MSETIVSLNGVVKSYGTHQVLKGVNMNVNKGDIYGLIGKNGAGKTTLFKVVLGLSDFQEGTLSLFGGKNEEENRKNRCRVGFFVGSNFFGYLNGRQNIDYYRQVKGIKDKSEVDRVLELVGLNTDAAKAPAQRYSLGMKQRLGIANALLGDPELLIFDEPTNGLDPQGIHDIRELIVKLGKEYGKTVIVSSHILSELENTADRFGIVHEGIIMKEMTHEQINEQSGLFSIDISEEDAKKAQELLSSNGIKIASMGPKESSLEDFYFRLIGGQD